jgi:hypothetical protein
MYLYKVEVTENEEENEQNLFTFREGKLACQAILTLYFLETDRYLASALNEIQKNFKEYKEKHKKVN